MHSSGWRLKVRGIVLCAGVAIVLTSLPADTTSCAAENSVTSSAGPRSPQHVRALTKEPTGFLARTRSALSGIAKKLSPAKQDAGNVNQIARPTREADAADSTSTSARLFDPLKRLRSTFGKKKGTAQSQDQSEEAIIVVNADRSSSLSRKNTTAAPGSFPISEPSEIPVFENSRTASAESVSRLQQRALQSEQRTEFSAPQASGRVNVGRLGLASPEAIRGPAAGRISIGQLTRRSESNAGRASIRQLGADAAPGSQEAQQIRIPVHNLEGKVQSGGAGNRISLSVRDAPLSEVLGLLAEQHGLNIVTASSVTGSISVSLADISLEDALNAILTVNGYTWVQQRNIILVSKLDQESRVSHFVQGREMRIFSLTYVTSEDINAVVTGLLSPVGQSFGTTLSPTDKRKTQEQIAVEDLPEYLARIESYIAQADRPPRQVLIEAHILRVDLKDDLRHGVDLKGLARLSGAKITMESTGFANSAASPAFLLGIDGTDLDGLVEALQSTTDAKTLASPKVLAVNGQEARIQVGERLGYLVTTTTQTSTLQNVNFLDTGIVLTVTPVIAESGQILMTIVPKISSGRVNPDTGLPEEETTDVQTTVMLRDGQAMVIGGLITEQDVDLQSKVPIAGDLWGVGRLFQRRVLTTERSEIIIALIPRVVPYDPSYQSKEDCDVYRATTPLTQWPLHEATRELEAELPDASKNPRKPRWDRIFDVQENLEQDTPRPPEYYFPSRQDPQFYDSSE